MALAEAADQADVPDGMSVPEELARREDRLARIAEAKATIEARAKERFAREQAEHQAKLKAREEKAKRTGRKPGGRPPQPPSAAPGPSDQVNLTDPDSRIMPVAGGGFEQAYNAQAAVASGSLLVVTADVVQAANDKQQIAPTLGTARPSRGRVGQAGDPAGGQRLLQRGQRGGLRRGQDRAADRAGPRAPSSRLAGALRRSAAGAREADAARSDGASTGNAAKAGKPTPCASRPRSRCSASSSRRWASDNSPCAASTRSKANGRLVTLAWNMKRMFALGQA